MPSLSSLMLSSLSVLPAVGKTSVSNGPGFRERTQTALKAGVIGPEQIRTGKRTQTCMFFFLSDYMLVNIFLDPKLKPNNAHNMSGPKTFVEPSGVIIPPLLPVWSNTVRSVNTNPKNRKEEFLSSFGGLAFPDPALFVGIQTDAKQAIFFMNWLKHWSGPVRNAYYHM